MAHNMSQPKPQNTPSPTPAVTAPVENQPTANPSDVQVDTTKTKNVYGTLEQSALYSEDAFECNVSQYSTQMLTQAEHTDELIKDGSTHIRVDYKVSGTGSNSCGPRLRHQYCFNDRYFTYDMTLLPAREPAE